MRKYASCVAGLPSCRRRTDLGVHVPQRLHHGQRQSCGLVTRGHCHDRGVPQPVRRVSGVLWAWDGSGRRVGRRRVQGDRRDGWRHDSWLGRGRWRWGRAVVWRTAAGAIRAAGSGGQGGCAGGLPGVHEQRPDEKPHQRRDGIAAERPAPTPHAGPRRPRPRVGSGACAAGVGKTSSAAVNFRAHGQTHVCPTIRSHLRCSKRAQGHSVAVNGSAGKISALQQRGLQPRRWRRMRSGGGGGGVEGMMPPRLPQRGAVSR
jgi:hypothetical protein